MRGDRFACYHFAMSHTGDKQCFTAEVFIVHKDKVLLRMHDKYKIWLSVGGHIEPNEDPNQAALREVKEEVGLDVVLWDEGQKFTVNEGTFRNLVPPVGLNCHMSDTNEHVTLVYFATASADKVVPEKTSDEWRWVSKEELGSMDLRENVREYALGALKALGTSSS